MGGGRVLQSPDLCPTDYPQPFYDSYFGKVPVDENGCRPQVWVNGRRVTQVPEVRDNDN